MVRVMTVLIGRVARKLGQNGSRAEPSSAVMKPHPAALPMTDRPMITGSVTSHWTAAPRGANRRRTAGIVVAASAAMITDWIRAWRSMTATESAWPEATNSAVTKIVVDTETAA